MNHPQSLRCYCAAPLAAALLLAFPAEAAPPVPPLPECAEPVTPDTLSPGQGPSVSRSERASRSNGSTSRSWASIGRARAR